MGDYAPIECPVSLSLLAQRQVTMAARRTHCTLKVAQTLPDKGESLRKYGQSMFDIVAGAAASVVAANATKPSPALSTGEAQHRPSPVDDTAPVAMAEGQMTTSLVAPQGA